MPCCDARPPMRAQISAILTTLLFGATVASQDPAPKLPIPDPVAAAKAEKLVKELFKDEYARKEPAAILQLANKLHEQARATKDDPAARFVLYWEAWNLAAQAGDFPRSLTILDEFGKQFGINSPQLKAGALDKASNSAKTPAAAKSLAETALGVVEEASLADDFESATKLLKVAEAAAARAKSIALISSVQARRQVVERLAAEFKEVQLATQALQKEPKNAAAHLTIGTYLCLSKGNWDRGLGELAAGSDAKLAELAKNDMEQPDQAAGQVAVGDGWFDAAEAANRSALAKSHLQRRAYYWYAKALPSLTGLTQVRVSKRVRLVLDQFPDLEPTIAVGELHKFEGHTAWDGNRLFTRDSRRLLFCSGKSIILFDVVAGQEVRRFEGHTGGARGVAFAADDRWVVSAGADRTIRFWDADTGREIKKLNVSDENGWNTPQPSRDGKRLTFTTDSNGTLVHLWDLEANKEIRQFSIKSGTVHSYTMAISSDGKRVLSGGFENMFRLWDVETGKEIRRFDKTPPVYGGSFSADGKLLLTAGSDNVVRLWDVATGKEVRSLTAHTSPVFKVAFSADGRYAISGGGADQTVRYWDLNTGKELYVFRGHSNNLHMVAIAPDNRRAVSAAIGDKTVRVWGLPK